jgi:hypothetical protein
MPPAAVPPEKRADVERLAHEIQDAVAAEIDELATNLITTDDAHLFGANEFQIRALAHRIAAKAIERHLAQKKHQQTRRVPLGSRAPACISAGLGRAGYKKKMETTGRRTPAGAWATPCGPASPSVRRRIGPGTRTTTAGGPHTAGAIGPSRVKLADRGNPIRSARIGLRGPRPGRTASLPA